MVDQDFRKIVREQICAQTETLKMALAGMIVLALFLSVSIVVTEPGTATRAIAVVDLGIVVVFGSIAFLLIRYCQE